MQSPELLGDDEPVRIDVQRHTRSRPSAAVRGAETVAKLAEAALP